MTCGGRCGHRCQCAPLSGPFDDVLQELSETADLVTQADVGWTGPGDRVGRFPPVTAPGGRTMGEPCAGSIFVCSAEDSRAWLVAAKTWLRDAEQTRATVRPSTPGLELAEEIWRKARALAAGPQSVSASIRMQLLAKTALELLLRACEASGQRCQAPVERPDPLTDPQDVPQDRPWFPGLPNLGDVARWALPIALLWLALRSRR